MNENISVGAPVKTMTEVLEEHPSLYGAYEWTCSGCMADIGNVWSGIGPALLAAHQAERLTAAGFEPVVRVAEWPWDDLAERLKEEQSLGGDWSTALEVVRQWAADALTATEGS